MENQHSVETFGLHAPSLQSCLTLCDPVDCSLPGSSIHGFPRQESWSRLPFPSLRLRLRTVSEDPKTSCSCHFFPAALRSTPYGNCHWCIPTFLQGMWQSFPVPHSGPDLSDEPCPVLCSDYSCPLPWVPEWNKCPLTFHLMNEKAPYGWNPSTFRLLLWRVSLSPSGKYVNSI